MLRQVLAHPLVPAILAIVAPVAGFWVALRNQEIKEALATLSVPIPAQVLGIDGSLFVFVALLVALGLGFAAHKWAEANAIAERQAMLEENIRVMATLGVERAAQQFREAVHDSFSPATLAFAPAVTGEQLARAIRIVLGNLAVFAKELDLAPRSTAYSCSLMLYWPRSQLLALSEERRATLMKRAVFAKHLPRDPAQLAGVLELRRELSTSTELGGREPDPSTPEIVLPVNASTFSKGPARHKYAVLPGAPYSAATRQFAVFRTIEAIMAWCEHDADFSAGLRTDIRDFFERGPGRTVKSVATIPVLSPGEADAQGGVLGVIALQRSSPNILPAGRHQIFMPIATPLVLFVAQLLIAYRASGRY
jgi:hypothetical protein